MNKVILIGNIATDPEAFTTQSGVSMSKFKIAVQRQFKNSHGEREADFFMVVAWRSTADFCNRYLAKGRKIAVEGCIQNRSYEAQDGSKRWITEINAESIEALGRVENGGDKGRVNEQPPTDNDAPDDFTQVDDDEELPFQ